MSSQEAKKPLQLFPIQKDLFWFGIVLFASVAVQYFLFLKRSPNHWYPYAIAMPIALGFIANKWKNKKENLSQYERLVITLFALEVLLSSVLFVLQFNLCIPLSSLLFVAFGLLNYHHNKHSSYIRITIVTSLLAILSFWVNFRTQLLIAMLLVLMNLLVPVLLSRKSTP